MSESKELLGTILNTMTDVVYLRDRDHNILYVNDAAHHFFSKNKGELLGQKCFHFFGHSDVCLNCPAKEVLQTDKPSRKEFFHTELNAWINLSLAPILDKNGNTVHILASFNDITSEKRLENIVQDCQENLHLLLNRMPLGCVVWDTDFRATHWNKAAEKIFGYEAEEVLGKHPYEIIVPKKMIPKTDVIKQRLLDGDEAAHRQGKNITKDGREIICDWTNTPMRDENGDIKGVLSVVQDVTELYKHQEALSFQALHDSLTELPNRHWFNDRLAERIAMARSDGEPFALALMDINRFKEINDTLGHRAGDQILKEFATRIKKSSHQFELARLGGDEFVFLLSRKHRVDIEKDLLLIMNLMGEPFSVRGLGISVSASIGVACFPEHGETGSDLLRKADIAMYLAKEDIHNISYYNERINPHSEERLHLLSELGLAISKGQLRLAYQPKVSLQDGQLKGFEALVRWHHPERGIIPPNDYIPLIEHTDLIVSMTDVIFDSALKHWRKMADSGQAVPIAINLSPRLLLDGDFPKRLNDLITRYNIPTGAIEIELTETAIILDPIQAGQVLQTIANMGVRLSIDDYGTGYSSLTLLKQLPIDALKIDMTFIQNMIKSEQDRIIVKSTIDMARGLGLCVIAEGVEDKETLTSLQKLGCDQAQGFYIDRPLNPADAMNWKPFAQPG